MVNWATEDSVRGSAARNGSQATANPPANAPSAASHCRRGSAKISATNAAAHGLASTAAASASPAHTGWRRATACSAATEKHSASRSSRWAKWVVSSVHTGRKNSPARKQPESAAPFGQRQQPPDRRTAPAARWPT